MDAGVNVRRDVLDLVLVAVVVHARGIAKVAVKVIATVVVKGILTKLDNGI